jgi:hypothetical protein
MTMTDDVHDVETDDLESGHSRRSFLRWGAFGAAATAAYTVAGIAGAGDAEAANGGTFLLGTANSAGATTELSGGSSLVDLGGTSYVVSGVVHAAVAGEQSENGSIAVYGKDTSSQGATGVRGDGFLGVLGQGDGSTGGSVGVKGLAFTRNAIGVVGQSVSTDATGGAIGVLGNVSNTLDTAVWAQHTGAGNALLATSSGGMGAFIQSGSGTGLQVASSSGAVVQIDPTGLSTVPPTTGNWTAGQMLMKHGVLFYCWKSGAGSASKWSRMSSALVTLSTPKRAYDSHQTGGALTGGHARTITVAKSATGVPVGVSAALISITATATGGAGSLVVYSSTGTTPSTRTLSWWGKGQAHTTTTVSRLSSDGKIKVRPTSKVQVLVDVLGYYP